LDYPIMGSTTTM